MSLNKFKKFRPLKKGKKIQPYAVVDTETWGLGGKLAFGIVYITDNLYFIFKNKAEFYEIIKENKIKKIYAHNLDFDAIKIRGKSSVEDVKNPIFAGGLLLHFEDEHGLKWYDSYSLLKSTASKLGEALGYKKLPTPEKFINPTSLKTITKTDIRYCKRDCKIIKMFLDLTFQLSENQKLTIASTAMFIFRKQYLKNELIVSNLHTNFQKSYYGGRVEAFKLGKTNAKVVDINSLYPYVMKITNLPHPGFLKEVEGINKNEFLTFLYKYEGCAECTIYQPKQKICCLPYRANGKLLFPYGEISGCWNFNEIRFALDNGCELVDVKKITYSTANLTNFFTDFVNDFYSKKSSGKGAEKLFYKFILNSLYGKFGESKHTKRDYFEAEKLLTKINEVESKNYPYKIEQLGRNYYYIDYEQVDKDPPIHQIYSICSYITSAARIELLRNLLLNEDKVVYCDTDSMAIEGEYTGEITDELGGWSYENYTITKIIGNKFYKTDKGLKAKGIPKSAKIQGKSFAFNHLIKTRESIRRDKKAGTTVPMTKKINFDYDKRKVLKGGATEPINVIELVIN